MGCDIHMYLEYVEWEDTVRGVNFWHAYVANEGSRDYTLFGWLAGVRHDPPHLIVPPRGLPDNLSYRVKQDAFLYVSDEHGDDEGFCTTSQAFSWGVVETKEDGTPTVACHPDWHSHSWLTPDEYSQILAAYTLHTGGPPNIIYQALLNSATYFESLGKQARLVFWFDN